MTWSSSAFCLALVGLSSLCSGAQQERPRETALHAARREYAAGHLPQAVAKFREAATQRVSDFTAEDSLHFATALNATGDSGGALQALQDASLRFPTAASLPDAEGVLLAQGGQMDQALALFLKSIEADRSFASAQYHAGTTLLTIGRPDEALPYLEAAAQLQSDRFDIQLQLGRDLSALHSDEEALTHLHRAADLMPKDAAPQALYALALALQASGDPKASVPLFDRALQQMTNVDAPTLTNAALAHTQTGDAPAALVLYAKALDAGPDSSTLREDYGATYMQQGDLQNAMEQFRAGLRADPQNAQLHYDLGLALKLKDNLTESVAEFQTASALDPSLPDPALTLGVIYMQQGKFSEAATQLKQVTTLQPQNGDAWAMLGSVLKDGGDATGAAAALKQAIQLQPDQPSLHIQLATLEAQAGEKDAAAADRKIAADLSRAAMRKQRAGFALKSGKALLGQNKLEEAIYQLKTAEEAEPDSVETHQLLAEAYRRSGKSEQAAAEQKLAQKQR